jgi:two-component system response regulator FixJ
MSSERMLVHVIDDDEAMRESLIFLLRTAKIDAEAFPSATAFLASLPDARLSCVITDVRMPEMSGLDLLRRLREMKIEVPVIVVTGHGADIESRIAALSNRERDVLGGLVAGRANKQIAYDLGISPRTVEIYRANLMDKMRAGSLSDLVRMALIVGILGQN